MLIIHGNNDENVPFQQSTDLVEKLRAQIVAFHFALAACRIASVV